MCRRCLFYCHQLLSDSESGKAWSVPGPYAGIYDSAETALMEAFAHVDWSQVS
jgi:hypothetical protein